MRRYRKGNIKIDWDDLAMIDTLIEVADDVTLNFAERVKEKAIQNLERQGAVDTGRLIDEIDIRTSKFKAGGYAVVAQGPGNYSRFYASFIELGGHYSLWGKYTRKKGNSKEGPYFPPRPYLRPALKYVKKKYKKALAQAFAGALNVETRIVGDTG